MTDTLCLRMRRPTLSELVLFDISISTFEKISRQPTLFAAVKLTLENIMRRSTLFGVGTSNRSKFCARTWRWTACW